MRRLKKRKPEIVQSYADHQGRGLCKKRKKGRRPSVARAEKGWHNAERERDAPYLEEGKKDGAPGKKQAKGDAGDRLSSEKTRLAKWGTAVGEKGEEKERDNMSRDNVASKYSLGSRSGKNCQLIERCAAKCRRAQSPKVSTVVVCGKTRRESAAGNGKKRLTSRSSPPSQRKNVKVGGRILAHKRRDAVDRLVYCTGDARRRVHERLAGTIIAAGHKDRQGSRTRSVRWERKHPLKHRGPRMGSVHDIGAENERAGAAANTK